MRFSEMVLISSSNSSTKVEDGVESEVDAVVVAEEPGLEDD